jgi:lipopolysaccharide export system protein LptA
MKRSEAARYARWSAAAALLLAALTAGMYVERKWAAHREKQKAPPPAPKDVSRLLNGISFSKMNGDQKIFTVDASKSTDFKDRDASLLEDVKITIFGKTGSRHDTIHTQSCQYERVGGGITCSGEVQFDLQSAADALREAKQPGSTAKQQVHVETRGVTFNRATGMASTDQLVKFVFPHGTGEGVGVEYLSEAGEMRVLKDVHLLLAPPETAAAKNGSSKTTVREPVDVTGKSLDFGRDLRILHLQGPLKAESSKAQLVAGELTLTLDTTFRAEKLVATAGATEKNPELASQEKDGHLHLSAETLTAHFAPGGWLTTLEGSGNVQGSRSGGTGTDQFTAESASLELVPKVNQPRVARLTNHVVVRTSASTSGQQRMLQTGALLVAFAVPEKGEPARPKHAETLSAGSIEWTEPPAQSATPGSAAGHEGARTKLQADKLEMVFGDEGQAKELVATGNVRSERAIARKPLQSASAQQGVTQLLANGGWSQMDLQGGVKLKEADRSGQADRAVFVRATQIALLTGKAVARDATTETQAPRITFSQATGEIHAEGGVRSSDFSSKGSAVQLAPVPVNISSSSMQGDAKTGRAVYSGNARLWQGDSVVEAESIELLRETKVLNATGNVRAVFPQTAGPSPSENLAVPTTPKKSRLWHVAAGTLTYRDEEGRAHLEKNVVAESAEQTMRGSAVDLYFTRSGTGATTANLPSGAQQISRAVGTGGVIVEQGARKATADRGEYSSADGKFVMSGGNPTIYDASEGTTTGHQLTFFLADDTIIIDSDNGSRTLTKHRVEK